MVFLVFLLPVLATVRPQASLPKEDDVTRHRGLSVRSEPLSQAIDLNDIYLKRIWLQYAYLILIGVLVMSVDIGRIGKGVLAAICFIAIFRLARCAQGEAGAGPDASSAHQTQSQQVASAPVESEEQKAARIKAELQAKAEVLAVRDLVSRTYESVKDKRSMEILRAKTDVKDKRLSACMVFTAKNGFGGVNEGQAVWFITAGKSDGRFAIDQPKIWEQYCTGARGILRTSEALEMLAYLHSR